jgi:hypothetical protein
MGNAAFASRLWLATVREELEPQARSKTLEKVPAPSSAVIFSNLFRISAHP